MVSVSGDYTVHNHDGYREYRVSAYGNLLIRLSSGDNFENAHINMEAAGARATILPYHSRSDLQTDWAIRNVAFTGTWPSSAGYHITPAAADTGNGLIENVYMRDGATNYGTTNYSPNPGGMWAPPEHAGTVTIRGVSCERMVDNAFYLSAPAWTGANGNFEIENCYLNNNSISGIRLCGSDTITNTFSSTGDAPAPRALWIYRGGTGTPVVTDSTFVAGDRSVVVSGDMSVEMVNSSWGGSLGSGTIIGTNQNDLSEFVPAGCPMSPEEAYLGDGTTGYTPPEDDPDDEVDETPQYTIVGEDRRSPVTRIPTGTPTGPLSGIGLNSLNNVHINGGETGVHAEDGLVVVYDSQIEADTPRSVNTGDIYHVRTGWGDDANPSMPSSIPKSVQEASGRVEDAGDPR